MWMKTSKGSLVNMDHVKSISPFGDEMECHLIDGSHDRLAFYRTTDADRAKLMRILNQGGQ